MLKFNNKVLKIQDKWLNPINSPVPPVDPYNPLDLPANTVRVRTSDGNVPNKTYATYETATLVPGTSDVYDVYKSGTYLYQMFSGSSNVIEVLGANTSGITTMAGMFSNCTSLQSVALFDTSKVTDMNNMFNDCEKLTTVPLFDTSNVIDANRMFSYCYHLTTVPLFDTSKVTHMDDMFSECAYLQYVPLFNTSRVTTMIRMFYMCTGVKSGALALYQQASTQRIPPSNHNYTFRDCGSYTQTGAAELAQIPSSWGGTGA